MNALPTPVALIDLWLPILVSSVAIWIAAAIAWMALGHHKKDMKALPPAAEGELKEWIVRHGVKPGVYGYPDFEAARKLSKDEQKALYEKPMGILRVWPEINMAVPMIGSFLWYVLIGLLLAYIGHAALPKGAEFVKVMQVLGTAGVLAYCFGGTVRDMWYQESRRAMVLCFIDGAVFGLLTGAIFAWLWPR